MSWQGLLHFIIDKSFTGLVVYAVLRLQPSTKREELAGDIVKEGACEVRGSTSDIESLDDEELLHHSASASKSLPEAEPALGTSTLCPSEQRGECVWKFRRYVPSSLEEQWWEGVDTFGYPGADVCRAANVNFKDGFQTYIQTCTNPRLITPDAAPFAECDCSEMHLNASLHYDPRVFSTFEYVNECTGEMRQTSIEPLAGILRHPLACQAFIPTNILMKSWMVVDQWSLHEWSGASSRRFFYFDAGASTWTEGLGGASQSWFDNIYRSKCVQFDGYWLWEAQPLNSQSVFQQLPPEVMPKYHWFNIPADFDPNSKLSPLYHIKAVAKPEDYVIFKLDIDNPPVEEAIIQAILDDETLQGLIDEIFWEHHINMFPMSRVWTGGHTGKGQRLSIGIFRRLRQAGIRAHSWV